MSRLTSTQLAIRGQRWFAAGHSPERVPTSYHFPCRRLRTTCPPPWPSLRGTGYQTQPAAASLTPSSQAPSGLLTWRLHNCGPSARVDAQRWQKVPGADRGGCKSV